MSQTSGKSGSVFTWMTLVLITILVFSVIIVIVLVMTLSIALYRMDKNLTKALEDGEGVDIGLENGIVSLKYSGKSLDFTITNSSDSVAPISGTLTASTVLSSVKTFNHAKTYSSLATSTAGRWKLDSSMLNSTNRVLATELSSNGTPFQLLGSVPVAKVTSRLATAPTTVQATIIAPIESDKYSILPEGATTPTIGTWLDL